MSLAVALEVVLSREGLMAERALEGPRSTVQGQVVFEVVGVEKSSGAVWAGVRTLAGVFPHVDFQFVISDEQREEIRCKKGKKHDIKDVTLMINEQHVKPLCLCILDTRVSRTE